MDSHRTVCPGDFQTPLEALQLELKVKDERIKVLLEENEGRWKENADMSRKVDEQNEDVVILRQEMEEEREKNALMMQDKEAMGLKLVEVLERVQALEVQLQVGGSLDEDPHEEVDVADFQSALATQARELDALARMDDTNSALGERITKFNEIRSQLQSTVDQANVQAARLHRELDHTSTFFLLYFLCFVLFLFLLFILKHLHWSLESFKPPPTRTCNSYF